MAVQTRAAAVRPAALRSLTKYRKQKTVLELLLTGVFLALIVALIVGLTIGFYYLIFWLIADAAGFGFKWGIVAVVAAVILSGMGGTKAAS